MGLRWWRNWRRDLLNRILCYLVVTQSGILLTGVAAVWDCRDVKDLLIDDQAHLWMTAVSCFSFPRVVHKAEPETIASILRYGWRDRIKSTEKRDWCRAWPPGKLRVRLETGHLYTRIHKYVLLKTTGSKTLEMSTTILILTRVSLFILFIVKTYTNRC